MEVRRQQLDTRSEKPVRDRDVGLCVCVAITDGLLSRYNNNNMVGVKVDCLNSVVQPGFVPVLVSALKVVSFRQI